MGYTHYWKLKKEATKEQIEKVLSEVKKMVALLPSTQTEPIVLCGGDGTGKPEFTKENIYFNGDGSQNLDHETFGVNFKPTDFDFCKTARKPYDMVVCLCLISLRNNIPEFSFSSDGDLTDEWKPAFDFYMEQGYQLTFDPDEHL